LLIFVFEQWTQRSVPEKMAFGEWISHIGGWPYLTTHRNPLFWIVEVQSRLFSVATIVVAAVSVR